MNAINLRRWLVRGIAFSAILFYGVFMVSSPRQLRKLLDVAFDVVPKDETYNPGFSEDSAPSPGFSPTRYHRHIRTVDRRDERNNYTDESSIVTSARNISAEAVRISFELHDPKNVSLDNTFNLYVKCPLGKLMGGRKNKPVPTGEFRTGELPGSLTRVEDERDHGGVVRSGRVLDFTVSVSTDLKLLLIGDSVMVQLGQAWDEIVGGAAMHSRRVVWEAWRGHDGGTVVAPTRGGGVSAMWRMTGLLSKSRKGKPPANSGGGGWSDKEINALSGYSYRPSGTATGGGLAEPLANWTTSERETLWREIRLRKTSFQRIPTLIRFPTTFPPTSRLRRIQRGKHHKK